MMPNHTHCQEVGKPGKYLGKRLLNKDTAFGITSDTKLHLARRLQISKSEENTRAQISNKIDKITELLREMENKWLILNCDIRGTFNKFPDIFCTGI